MMETAARESGGLFVEPEAGEVAEGFPRTKSDMTDQTAIADDRKTGGGDGVST
jgi:hypothetical protein